MKNTFSNEGNIARLHGIVARLGSMRKAADFLGLSNVKYLSTYLNEDLPISDRLPPKTKIGREAADALGIVDAGNEYTRKRRDVLNTYAREKKFKHWSDVETAIFRDGKDPLKRRDELE